MGPRVSGAPPQGLDDGSFTTSAGALTNNGYCPYMQDSNAIVLDPARAILRQSGCSLKWLFGFATEVCSTGYEGLLRSFLFLGPKEVRRTMIRRRCSERKRRSEMV